MEHLTKYDPRTNWQNSHDVGSGSWIMITTTPPVSQHLAPKLYNIYWAIPVSEFKEMGKDRFGRQAVKVHTSEDVTLFTDEYSLIDDKKLEEYKNLGWYLVQNNSTISTPLNLELIAKGRNLVEEEREIIWALMLEGLTEQQACEEYFLTKHIESNNSNIYYQPTKEVLNDLIGLFGHR